MCCCVQEAVFNIPFASGARVLAYSHRWATIDSAAKLNNIVCFGGSYFPYVCYYNKLGDILYSFNILSYNTFVGFGSNSLQFLNETNLFYISSSDQYVQHFKWQENYCANPSIDAYLNM